jgi:hypothetical protein
MKSTINHPLNGNMGDSMDDYHGDLMESMNQWEFHGKLMGI